MHGFPRFRPVAEQGVLIEFGDHISDAVHERVLFLDSILAAQGFDGFREAVPAYVNLLVIFDPLITDHARVERRVRAMLSGPVQARAEGTIHVVDVCYDAGLAPDLPEVARLTALSEEAVIAAHLSGEYRVFHYGFAPGYAYLAGVPEAIRLPRKTTAVRGVAAGSVIIAAAQCIISTLTMPTGWWIIGRSPTLILRDDPARPFLFDVGDRVRFRRIGRAELEAGQ
ncbi:MAG: allophanate hydrolase subunit 1 [Rhodobacterales bacterium]|nr:allophanate hydrolase subunit 1 [Rhodobacterales bacterium]